MRVKLVFLDAELFNKQATARSDSLDSGAMDLYDLPLMNRMGATAAYGHALLEFSAPFTTAIQESV